MDKIKTLISFIAEALSAGRYITDLQKAIWDTWNEYHKQEFDIASALTQIFENAYNDQFIHAATISKIAQYITEKRPLAEAELKELLSLQFDILTCKELGENYHGQ